jgi:hypothetical protein
MHISVRMIAETETQMTSVERLIHYSKNIASEAPQIILNHRPSPDWPNNGDIRFNNVKNRNQ